MNHLVSSNEQLRESLALLSAVREAEIAKRTNPAIEHDEVIQQILERWRDLDHGRIIIGIGGCPASGKTTMARWIVQRINEMCVRHVGAHLPMDGFHLPDVQLIGGGLDAVKGDIRTYALPAYRMKLMEFTQRLDSTIYAPDYDREKHDIVEDAIEIAKEVRILVTEGIYVGYPEGDWAQISNMLEILYFLDTSPEECADRIVTRNLAVGRSESLIERKLTNDFGFMQRSLQILQNADYVISTAPPSIRSGDRS